MLELAIRIKVTPGERQGLKEAVGDFWFLDLVLVTLSAHFVKTDPAGHTAGAFGCIHVTC